MGIRWVDKPPLTTATSVLASRNVSGVISEGPISVDNLSEQMAASGAISEVLDYLRAVQESGGKPVVSMELATTGNITLSGEQTIDTVMTSASKVLVKDQADAAQNGPYVSGPGAWTRLPGYADGAALFAAQFAVTDGDANKATRYGVTNPTVPVVGADSIVIEFLWRTMDLQIASVPEAIAGIEDTKAMTPLKVATKVEQFIDFVEVDDDVLLSAVFVDEFFYVGGSVAGGSVPAGSNFDTVEVDDDVELSIVFIDDFFYVGGALPVTTTSSTGAEELPAATDGATLHRVRAKAATILNSGSAIIRVATLLSDSWGDRPAIPLALKTGLVDAYGASGHGWISIDSDSGSFAMPGCTLTKSGWSVYDASSSGAPDGTVGCGLDGKAISTTGTSATASIVVQCETFKIGYRDTNGTFRYRIDYDPEDEEPSEWVTVSGTSSGDKLYEVISGLSDASHTIEIDTTGNAGTVAIHNFIALRSASGVEFHKIGNGGINAAQIATFLDLDDVQVDMNELGLDLGISILGTNDYREGIPIATFGSVLTNGINRARTAVPDCGHILWAPADSDGVTAIPLTDYRDEMYRLSKELGCEFFNHHKLFGTFEQADALGQWADNLHVSDIGGFSSTREMTRRLYII